MTIVGLALAFTMACTNVAHADVTANHYAQSEWRKVDLGQQVLDRNGNVYLPMRSTFNALGADIEWKPEGRNIVQVSAPEKEFTLFLKTQGNQTFISTQNGQLGDAIVVEQGNSYVQLASLQKMLNRTVCVSGLNQVTLVDYQPKWQNGNNVNSLWKNTLAKPVTTQRVVAPAAPVAPQATAAPQTVVAPKNNVVAPKKVVAPAAPVAPANGKYAAAVGIAQQFYGVPYVWGGSTPAGFDCSGLTSYVYNQMGVKIPRTSQQQQAFAKPISFDQLQPGDLVFWGAPATHVGIYIGNGQYVHAAASGQVEVGNYNWYPYTSAGRIA